MRSLMVAACVLIAAFPAFPQSHPDAATYYLVESALGTRAAESSQADALGSIGLRFSSVTDAPPLTQLFRFVPAEIEGGFRIVTASTEEALAGRGKGQTIAQAPVSDDKRQIVFVDDLGGNAVRLRFAYSNLSWDGANGTAAAGTSIVEWSTESDKGRPGDRLRLLPWRSRRSSPMPHV